mmetsp:Transcript_112669/g.318329  ORF Transcript_112669/g.318329 Transcript_112669/m.318329 type:complete len:237 (+) Transcript_112669:238-948(+)
MRRRPSREALRTWLGAAPLAYGGSHLTRCGGHVFSLFPGLLCVHRRGRHLHGAHPEARRHGGRRRPDHRGACCGAHCRRAVLRAGRRRRGSVGVARHCGCGFGCSCNCGLGSASCCSCSSCKNSSRFGHARTNPHIQVDRRSVGSHTASRSAGDSLHKLPCSHCTLEEACPCLAAEDTLDDSPAAGRRGTPEAGSIPAEGSPCSQAADTRLGHQAASCVGRLLPAVYRASRPGCGR